MEVHAAHLLHHCIELGMKNPLSVDDGKEDDNEFASLTEVTGIHDTNYWKQALRIA